LNLPLGFIFLRGSLDGNGSGTSENTETGTSNYVFESWLEHNQSASSTFLSEQISISHQPPAKWTGWICVEYWLILFGSLNLWV
jgi:hypothetical protein